MLHNAMALQISSAEGEYPVELVIPTYLGYQKMGLRLVNFFLSSDYFNVNIALQKRFCCASNRLEWNVVPLVSLRCFSC